MILSRPFFIASDSGSISPVKNDTSNKVNVSTTQEEINTNINVLSKDDYHANINLTRIERLEKSLSEEVAARKLLAERLNKLEATLPVFQFNDEVPNTSDERAYHFDPTTPEPSESISEVLSRSGLSSETNDHLKNFIGAHRMELVELRDKAGREGWIDTPVYLEMRDSLADPDKEIREIFGDAVYERYLYAMGVPNRLMVNDVYTNTQASDIEIQPGDIILRYDSEPIFIMSDLNQATVAGNKGEAINMDFIRNGQNMSVVVQRGPIGINLERIIHAPITTLSDR